MIFIILTVFEDAEGIFNSLSAGACGYILIQTPPAKLLEAIQDVHRGGSPMSNEIARKVVQTFQKPVTVTNELSVLTAREEEILSYLANEFELCNQYLVMITDIDGSIMVYPQPFFYCQK